MSTDEIVEEVLGPREKAEDEERSGTMRVVPPLVAVRHDGEELPVLFPRAVDEAALGSEGDPDGASLPPVLSAAEVAAAMPAAVADTEEPVGLDGVARATGVAGDETASHPPPDDMMRVASAPGEELDEETERESGPVAAEPVDVGQPATPKHAVQEVLEPAVADDVDGDVDGEAGEATRRPGPVKNVSPDDGAGPSQSAESVVEDETAEGPESRAAESPVPSGRHSVSAVPGAGQAGDDKTGLPPRPAGEGRRVVVPGTLRGVMGYRLPLVSRQEVPDQIVSGVLIPAHTTFVVLKAGSWELVDVSPEEVELLRQIEARREAEAAAEPEKRGWNPLRIFRRQETPAEE